MSKQQTIGVDIDDVLAAHLPAFIKYTNDTYNTGLTAEADVTALLFGGYTWSSNQPVHTDVVRVNNWQEVGKYFNV